MAESRILNEAARLLREALAGTPADQVLRAGLGRTRHRSAPAERRAVSRAVFAYFRWWRWLPPQESLQKQVAAALDLQARFDRSPASFKPETLAARAVPDWLKGEMDALPPEWLRQLQREPILWIRARSARAAAVAAALGDCAPAAHSPPGIRQAAFSYTGSTDLFTTPAYQAGDFEVQDLASQLVGLACAPQPGQTWWDACAGEGGKTLHLADLMQGRGLLWATDRSARRLARLRERAARAQVFNYRAAEWDGGRLPAGARPAANRPAPGPRLPTKAKFDGILVDAPCSGIGTWQRNPHARWTTQPADVRELAEVQSRLLGHVAGSLKPGGRLVYSVCTLTRAETTAVAAAFTAAHPDFAPAAVFPSAVAGLGAAGGVDPGSPPPTSAANQPETPPPATAVTLWPHELDANGMFLAAWKRKA